MDAGQLQDSSLSADSLSSTKYELQKADTTELPLAHRDEQPPLVVDLPEGQKLVVGKLEEGTVIEVASWKGTGRPDSRTSRLMLGITRDEPDPELAEIKRKFLKGNKKAIARNEEISEKEPSSSLQTAAARVNTGVNYEFVTPSASATLEKAKESKTKKKKNRFMRFIVRHRAGELIFVTLVIGSALLNTVGGISVVHPRSGAAISMGKVTDSLIAIKRSSKVAVGDKIVVSLGNKQSPELVIVQGVSPQSILTNISGKLLVVTPKQIEGRVLALFPYFGWPFNL
jgi:hypothetical protein